MSDYDAAALVRSAIRRLEPRFSRGKLAQMAGVTPTAISDFLNEKEDYPQIGMDKVTNLCRAVKIPVDRFLGVTSADIGRASNGTNPKPGDVIDAAEAGLLRAELEALRHSEATLRKAVAALGRQLVKLSVGKKTRRAQGGKP